LRCDSHLSSTTNIVALKIIRDDKIPTCIKYLTAEGLTVRQQDFHSFLEGVDDTGLEFLGDETGATGSMLTPIIYI